MTALEVLIDEAAAALPLNPIEFRRRNALKQNGRTMMGNRYIVSVRTPEILDKLEMHPIWRQRAEEKARLQHNGILVGTGVACVGKDYGSGGDCSLGRVELGADGKISIHGDHVEMGNGVGTALANRVAMQDPSTVPVTLAAAHRVGEQLAPEYEQMTPERRGGSLLPEHLVAQQAAEGMHVLGNGGGGS